MKADTILKARAGVLSLGMRIQKLQKNFYTGVQDRFE